MPKIMTGKIKKTDGVFSVRLTPFSVAQLDKLMDFTGENASRLFSRAIDTLYNRYADDIENGKLVKVGKPTIGNKR